MPTVVGYYDWGMTRDTDGNRDYKITFRVIAENSQVGPASILADTPGLPAPGDQWQFGTDIDTWAYAKLDADVKAVVAKEPNITWDVTIKFTSKPDDKKCKDQQLDDPLLIPDRISGSFTRYQEEITRDKDGWTITNSAFEQVRGPLVEFDHNRPSIVIEQNVAQLQLSLLQSMQDTLNNAPLWGVNQRCIKLSNISWERKFYGQCYLYYTRKLEFEVRPDTFDRQALDEGTKVLNGHWDGPTGNWVLDNIDGAPPDPTNPSHFIRATDKNGNPMKIILNGSGLPATNYGPLAPFGYLFQALQQEQPPSSFTKT